ncbi:ttuB [Scenedesmus sp. PABB004]|nr:ttuB [Scenedesmus sp. PABB004]
MSFFMRTRRPLDGPAPQGGAGRRAPGDASGPAPHADAKASVASVPEGAPAAPGAASAQLQAVYARTGRRLLPLFVLVVICNQLDRNNIAFAALTMNRDLGFSSSTYGVGVSMFFVTFCLFAVPSNLVMVRVGCRRWLALLVAAWGVVASCFALVHNAAGFFVLRLLLGAFESGATPAMWWHLTQFFPQHRLTKPYMWLTVGVLIANVLGAPVAAGLLAMEGLGGLHGWQWLFMLEGIPSVLLGGLLWLTLPDRPADAKWLSAEQKELLRDDMAESLSRSPPAEAIPRSPLPLLRMVAVNPLLLLMSLVGFLFSVAAYTYIFWSPIIISNLLAGTAVGLATTAAAHSALDVKPVLLTAVPYAVAGATAWAVAAHSERRNELILHTTAAFLMGGACLAAFPALAGAQVAAGFVALVGAAAAVSAANGPSQAITSRVSAGPSQVVGMPVYGAISVLGGVVGPIAVGTILQRSRHGFAPVFYVIGATTMLCGLLVGALRWLLPARERRLAAGGGGGGGVPAGAGAAQPAAHGRGAAALHA